MNTDTAFDASREQPPAASSPPRPVLWPVLRPVLRPAPRPLRISAFVELISLTVLLANIAAGNDQQVAAMFGPVHGIAWLFSVVATWRDPRGTTGAVLRAVIPGIGGMLAVRTLNRADAAPLTSAGSGAR